MNHDAPEDEAPEYRQRLNAPSESSEKEHYNKGVIRGIEFAVDHFLNNLPLSIANDLCNRTTDHLIKLYKEIDSYEMQR